MRHGTWKKKKILQKLNLIPLLGLDFGSFPITTHKGLDEWSIQQYVLQETVHKHRYHNIYAEPFRFLSVYVIMWLYSCLMLEISFRNVLFFVCLFLAIWEIRRNYMMQWIDFYYLFVKERKCSLFSFGYCNVHGPCTVGYSLLVTM